TRGCPWDCSFCSAWTFYGRSYRKVSPEAAADDLARIAEPNVFLVDDVAFIHPEHGFAIGRELEKRHVRKQYYLETRCDVLLRNREVFEYWRRLGLHYMFLGLEALDEDALRLHRKRITPGENFKALDVAREHGFAIGRELEKRHVRKQYYLETRCDVLLRNREVFEYWRRLGLHYMFLGLEALDEDALRLHRKRITPGENFKALDVARELGFT